MSYEHASSKSDAVLKKLLKAPNNGLQLEDLFEEVNSEAYYRINELRELEYIDASQWFDDPYVYDDIINISTTPSGYTISHKGRDYLDWKTHNEKRAKRDKHVSIAWDIFRMTLSAFLGAGIKEIIEFIKALP